MSIEKLDSIKFSPSLKINSATAEIKSEIETDMIKSALTFWMNLGNIKADSYFRLDILPTIKTIAK